MEENFFLNENNENHSNKQTNGKSKDSTLLTLEKKLEFHGNSETIIKNKFIFKPEIKKISKNPFLNKEKIDFLEQFKASTEELLKNPAKKNSVNIENPTTNFQGNFENNNITSNQSNEKFIEMNLKLGVLDLMPNCSESVLSTKVNSVLNDNKNTINENNLNFKENHLLHQNNYLEDTNFISGESNANNNQIMMNTQNNNLINEEDLNILSNDLMLKFLEERELESTNSKHAKKSSYKKACIHKINKKNN